MITGVVSEGEFVAAHALHRRTAAVVINFVLVVILLCGALLAALGVRPWGLMLLVGGVCGLIGEAAQARLYIPAKVRQLYAQSKGIDSPITYRWDAESVSVHSERGEGRRNWADLRKVRADDQLLLLYTNDALFEVVPKRWFRDSTQMEEFIKLAQGKRDS